jgi:heme o synthase
MKNNTIADILKNYCLLCKVKVALLSTFSSMTGYLLAKHKLDTGTLLLAAGVFLVACGCCALNQCQDRTLDALMRRTRVRPLPAGKIAPEGALSFSLILAMGGLFILFLFFGSTAFMVALLAMFWYNGIYTYLKRKSAFAVVPGALIGAAPPVIGWIAGGDSLSDFRIWVFSFFIFMWQMPHFWLLLLDHAEEYRSAGLPALEKFSRRQIERVVSQWLFTTALSCQLLSVFVASSFFTKGLLLSLSLLFILLASGLLNEKVRSYVPAFRIMNIVFLAALFVLFAEGLSRIPHFSLETILAQL